MRIRIAVPEGHEDPHVIDAALEAVTRLDESMIRQGQSPTSDELVAQGAIWRPEPPGDEHFDHGASIAARGWGDCDDWAPLRAATLRSRGEDPGAKARVIRSGPMTYHAVVQRSDGEIESGEHDISVQAGMRPLGKYSVSGGAQVIEVQARDPHDGRIYEGSLAPIVRPLKADGCGPAMAIRGMMVVGLGPWYETRVDLPIVGSPLFRVHGGVIPGAALSCVGSGPDPCMSTEHALMGAILCGDASELTTSLDRFKVLATALATSGASPGQVRDQIAAAMHKELSEEAERQGVHPSELLGPIVEELASQGHMHMVVGDIFGDIAHAAQGVIHAVAPAVNLVKKAAGVVPWGDIIHGAEAATSVVPGLGTAVSDVIATAETAYDSAAAFLDGNPLAAALHAAYNYALASVPGAAAIRFVLDPVVDTLINLTVNREPIESAILDAILARVPDQPNIGGISPRSIAASLAHIVVAHLGLTKTQGHAPVSRPAAKPKAAAVRPPIAHPLSLPHPLALPHLPLIHAVAPHPLGPVRAVMPAHPAVPPHMLVPGSPGAPPGATHWICVPGPGGAQVCRWE